MSHTALSVEELDVFRSLKNVKVVFDVGARDDVDYLIIKPNIQLYAFEPYKPFFEELKAQVKMFKNVHLNNYALGSKESMMYYDTGHQSLVEQENGIPIPVKTLDWYVKKNKIKKIDFLKIDVEGYELEVLRGASEAIKLCWYIQYETGTNDNEIQALLTDFDLSYLGGRNMFCVRKGQKPPEFPKEIREGGLLNKGELNILKYGNN